MHRIRLALISPAIVALALGTFLLTFLSLAHAQDAKREAQNPQASALSLERTGDQTALIRARFPELTRKEEAHLTVDGKRFTFRNDGSETGDQFVLETEFDAEHFIHGNETLARLRADQEVPVFAPGGRQVVATQGARLERDHLVIEQHSDFAKQGFRLPLDPDQFRIGQRLDIPVLGLPLGLPLDIRHSHSVDAKKSLMITDLDVVQDPGRTWFCDGPNQSPTGHPEGVHTFWNLMGNIAGGSSTAATSDYIKEFFNHWNENEVINGQLVAARPNVYNAIIEEWEQRSGGPGADLLPEQSPFRLLAVVLRLDLRGNLSPYGGGSAGEARYVFGLHDGNCNSMAKTIILEYEVPISSCTNIREWAQEWAAQENSSNYNADLEALTQVFASAGANPQAPNGSAIGQVRTNELLPISSGWELREFVLPETGGLLQGTTVKQEPQEQHNNNPLLGDYVNNHWQALIHHSHLIPEQYNDEFFLAGRAPAPLLWNVPQSLLSIPNSPVLHSHPSPNATNTSEALYGLGFNTCSGCHTLETGTPFAHVDYNSVPGQEAILSGFLEGITLPDPRFTSILREFDDLSRREADLQEAASMSCATIGTVLPGNVILSELTRAPTLNAVH